MSSQEFTHGGSSVVVRPVPSQGLGSHGYFKWPSALGAHNLVDGPTPGDRISPLTGGRVVKTRRRTSTERLGVFFTAWSFHLWRSQNLRVSTAKRRDKIHHKIHHKINSP